MSDYTYEHSVPQVIEIDGIRYCFLTCYDFYFYEIFPAIARQKPDIIIGCSHQRSDKQSALETINRFCAYNTNAYVVRSSVSMGEDTDIGGGSCVVAPDGVLDRVSDGTGVITDFTYEELLKLDFGFKCNEHFKGLKILKFEEILKKFAGHTIMNIHIKPTIS